MSVVADTATRWRVSFEHDLGDGVWRSVERVTDDEAGARDQIAGLQQISGEGELVRNWKLARADAPVWVEVEP